MKKILAHLSAIFVVIALFSCSDKEEAVHKVFDLSDKVLKIEEIANLAIRINEIHDEANLHKISGSEKERMIREELQVLVDNGKTLYNETMNHLESNAYAGLSDEDRVQLTSINEQNLAEFSVIMSFAYNYDAFIDESNKSSNDWELDRVMSCLGAALGLSEISTIISNTAQLTTVQGTTQLLKLVGKRYLGWLGVAVGVYSFGKCMDAW